MDVGLLGCGLLSTAGLTRSVTAGIHTRVLVSLTDVLRTLRRERRRLSPAAAVAIVLRVLEALERTALDGPRGDLSPDAIRFDRAGQLSLSAGARPDVALRYHAPEQARRHPTDGRSDLYAAGVLLWELLTGSGLVRGSTQAEILERLRAPAPPPPPSQLAPEVPRTLDAAVLALLAIEPGDRPRNVSEARHRLIAAMPTALELTDAELASLVDNTLAAAPVLPPTPAPLLELAPAPGSREVRAMVESLTLAHTAVTPTPHAVIEREVSQVRGRVAQRRQRDLLLIVLFASASLVVVTVLVLLLARP